MKKFVYQFDEGSKEMKNILGGKGAGLCEMARLGIPVPPGFIISAEVCDYYYSHNNTYPDGLFDEIREHLGRIEAKVGKKFGDPKNPLLVSVRSGAAVSMPGMMDTILNLGLNDEIVEKWLSGSGNERFAYDSYRRLLQMFGDVVYGIKHEKFEEILSGIKKEKGATYDFELDLEALKKIIESYHTLYRREISKDFPQDPVQQLFSAIEAVVKSWFNERAVAYRKLNKIENLLGTAVTVQSMVFGNMGKRSGTGVCFTRNPSTGEKVLYGEFLLNAQGEDVVAGIRTPEAISNLKGELPEAYEELIKICETLENHYRDMQDIEFTIEEGKLYLLQTRSGKRTAQAAVKIEVDLVNEGKISKKEALLRIEPYQIDQLLHKRFDEDKKKAFKLLTKGLPASPGAAVGSVVFSAEDAEKAREKGKKVILVRTETSPEDIKGMNSAEGILTSRGGMTSHAAVVARGMGKCCITGAEDLTISKEEKFVKTTDGTIIHEGDIISIDGATGEVFLGEVPVIDPELSSDFETILLWADEFRRLKIRTNADTPRDAEQARIFGAEGIGLCRTEHMFFEGNRIMAVREMILAENKEGRERALSKILPMQREDFIAIFRVMKGLPVTIRLLDPPLHEFLPQDEEDIESLAVQLNVSPSKIKEKISNLHELNPMLGHRGCRLGITYPEITRMQVRAIIEAACYLTKNEGLEIIPEIMVPLVGTGRELIAQKEIIEDEAEKIFKEQGVKLNYLIGTMIEIPRAALTAGEIGSIAQFFSFGTNDLTQMTFGFSRDDANKFLPFYIENKILSDDPFMTLDKKGVGRLIRIAKEEGRAVNPNLKIGICGEHGGDPKSIEFCEEVGLDYVSCSPFRVPIARLSAARASIMREKEK
jgi:pyruvate,orthophosphate dikinase